MDQESSANILDISDPYSVRLAVLGCLCSDGNGYAAWEAYRVCRDNRIAWPQWLTDYFDGAARFLLDEYVRDDKRDRQIEKALNLGSPKTNQTAASDSTSEAGKIAQWQAVTKSMLPGIIDDYATTNNVRVQTAIKELASTLGFQDAQWTQLRDAYDKVKSGTD
jgi:hypothetical protein